MRKTKRFASILLMMAVVLGGCGEGESQEAQRGVSNIYETEELVEVALNDVEYQIPEKWEEAKKESGDNTYYYSDGMMVMVQTSESDFDSLDALTEDEKEEAKEGIMSGMKGDAEYEEISGEFEEVSGMTSIRIKGICTISGEKGRQDSLMFAQNGIFYNFSIFEYEESNMDYGGDFEKLLGSINITEQKPESIDGFENASLNYEKFNSYASENGLDGTLIYIEGEVLNQTKIADTEVPLQAFVVEQEDGNRWCAIVSCDTEIDVVEGGNARMFGVYQGFSDVTNLPALIIATEDEEIMGKARIELEENGEYVTVWNFLEYTIGQVEEQESEKNVNEKVKDNVAEELEETKEPIELSTGKYIVGEDILSGKYDIVGLSEGNIYVCSQGKDYGDVVSEIISPGEIVYANVILEDGYTVELVLGGEVQLQPK